MGSTEKDRLPILEARELVKRFRVRQSLARHTVVTAVNGVSFSVRPRETVALVGESGCGKTTVGKLALGFLPPDAGQVRFRDKPLNALSGEERLAYRRSVQMVFQNPLASFNPMMSIGATLLDALRLRNDLSRSEKEAEVIRLLQRVGLEPEMATRYPSEMSGGQLQRVGVARALAPGPSFIFLDEPTSALDMSVRGQVINLLLDLQADRGLAYLLVSHDLRVVRAMAHYMLVMYLGQVLEEGPVEEVLSRPLHPYTQSLLAATLLGFLAQAPAVRRVRVRGEVLQLPPGYHGCSLYRRCPLVAERCQQEPQRLAEVSPGHWVRCWRVLEGAC
ncbi:MAG: oligopeptide/dipeptide ABC transporter ATP-binding protein [Chloroflexia bacterium]